MKIKPIYILLAFAFTGSMLFLACRTKFKPTLTSAKGIRFDTVSLDAAKAQAKTSGKPLFIFAHASWCATCKKMEQEVLVEQQIGNIYNAKLINVAIDVDTEEGKKLNDLYPIKATPSLFYFNSNGTLIKKWEGFATVPQLLQLAAEAGIKP